MPGTGEVGYATSKQIGSQPCRNRVKRRFKEAVRAVGGIDPRLDVVVMVHLAAIEVPIGEIEAELRSLFKLSNERWEKELESS